jgi:uncharacterized membrane protein YdfJ with MMPL/SSD domain
MSRLLYRLGALCVRRKYLVFLVWALIVSAVAGGVVQLGMRTNNDIRLPGTGTQQATDMLRSEFPPQQNGMSPLVFHVESGTVSDPAHKKAVKDALRVIEAMPEVHSVISPFSRAGESFVSGDGRTAVAQVLMNLDWGQLDKQLASRVVAAAEPARAAGIQVEAGGGIGSKMAETKSRRSETIGIAAAIVIMAFTFGALVAAGMPVVTALVGLVVGLGLVGLLGHVISIPTVGPTLATMIGLGVGIDYALFIVFRHRDQLHRGMSADESVAHAMATSGSAVVFAGGTVIVALLALLVARVPLLGAMGYAAALTVLVAVLTAITLLPALLAVLGRRIDAWPLPGRKSSTRVQTGESVWARWAGLVTRHPWIALVASLLVLAPLMAPTLTLRLGVEDVGVASTSTSQRRAFDLITAGLGPGANGPPPALRLKSRLEREGRLLKKKAAALEMRGDQLKTQKARLQGQATALQTRRSGLETQGAALQTQGAQLQNERSRLLAEKARLVDQKASLSAKGRALAVQGQKLQVQITAVKQELATATDPAVIAQLQAQLAALAAQAQAVQAEGAALEKQGAALEKQGKALEAKARPLAAEGQDLKAQAAELSAEGAALQAQGDSLARQGEALKQQGAALKSQARELERDKRAVERRATRARRLKADLTELLTRAGGQPRATDPRLVRLQDALEQTAGIVSVSPPRINKTGTAAILAATPTTRPADPTTADLVKRVRTTVLPAATRGTGVTAYVGGGTAAFSDLATLIAQRLPLVIATVLGLSFILLMLAFRSLLVPLKAVICNLLAVAASFGVLTAVFQWGWGLGLLGLSNPSGSVPIASYVPLLMFAVLFGLSTDYEVFLISQIFQAHGDGEAPAQAVRTGVGTSARVITAAAVIMVTVFASFLLNPDTVIKQFGVGLSIAIIIDTTIVRLVIVPATMVLLGEWNWYLPTWLQWLPHADLREESEPRSDA